MFEKKQSIKSYAISTLIIFFFLFNSQIILEILSALHIDYQNMTGFPKEMLMLGIELISAMVISLPYLKEIKSGLKDYKNHKNEYFKKYFKYWILIMAIMLLSNSLITLLKGETTNSVNEQVLREAFKQYPIYIYIATVFLAPIMEELIFRRSIRTYFTSDTLFIIMSGLLFGTVHLAAGMESIVDLLYIIPYGAPGAIFAYIYTKTNNITVPMSMHLFHNGVQMAFQIIMLLI